MPSGSYARDTRAGRPGGPWQTVGECFIVAAILAAVIMVLWIVPAHGGQCGERVDPPHDQAKPYLTVFGSAHDPAYQFAVHAFDHELKELRDSCHYNAIPTARPIFGARYKSNTPTLPCLRLQEGERVVAEYAGAAFPRSAAELRKAVETGLMNCRRQPAPGRGPDPDPQPLTPTTPPGSTRPSWAVGLGAILASLVGGVAIGVAVEWRRTYAKRK